MDNIALSALNKARNTFSHPFRRRCGGADIWREAELLLEVLLRSGSNGGDPGLHATARDFPQILTESTTLWVEPAQAVQHRFAALWREDNHPLLLHLL